MDSRLLLVTIVVGGSLSLHLLTLAVLWWNRTSAQSMRVVAHVTQIHICLEGWYGCAVWSDPHTWQQQTFRSPCLELHLTQRIGDWVSVDVNRHNLNHYRMKL